MGSKVSLDMGNSLSVIFRRFGGRDMECPYSSGPKAGVREVGSEGPTQPVGIVSEVWDQPQVRLQVETALRARRPAWTAESSTLSPTLAATNEPAMAEANSVDAAAAWELGKSKAQSAIGTGVQRRARSDGAYDWPVAPEDEAQPEAKTAFPAGTPGERGKVDQSGSKQPCVDGRLQGMVSHPGREASGAVDRTRPAQPFFAE